MARWGPNTWPIGYRTVIGKYSALAEIVVWRILCVWKSLTILDGLISCLFTYQSCCKVWSYQFIFINNRPLLVANCYWFILMSTKIRIYVGCHRRCPLVRMVRWSNSNTKWNDDISKYVFENLCNILQTEGVVLKPKWWLGIDTLHAIK